MAITKSLFAAALAAVALLSPSLRAQLQGLNPGDERKCSTLFLADLSNGFTPDAIKGGVNINFSQPEWKDSYNKELDSGRFNNSNQRLGKNWWTSFDTTMALDIGGTKIAPGAYYLGVHVDEKGNFQLMFMETTTVLKNGWAPFLPKPWQAAAMAPLTLSRDSLAETQKKMMISITNDEKNPTSGKFSIQWGKHDLWAPVKFMVPGAKDATAPKDKK